MPFRDAFALLVVIAILYVRAAGAALAPGGGRLRGRAFLRALRSLALLGTPLLLLCLLAEASFAPADRAWSSTS